MKMRKAISAVLAGVLALSALPISAMSASAAEGAYALGDVDMDGVITGHDAAMVSRYLHVDNTLLSADQLALADVNGDGVVDQADADWIHENETIHIGCIKNSPNGIDSTTVYYQMFYQVMTAVGIHVQIVDGTDLDTNSLDNHEISKVAYNLMDVYGDGVLNLTDCLDAMVYCGYKGAGYLRDDNYAKTGRYDIESSCIVAFCQAQD